MSGDKVALWGFGGMNKIVLGYLQEKGYKVVAVIGLMMLDQMLVK